MVKSVALIGLGGIGILYDLKLPNSVLSHARAFSEHNSFKLVGAVEPDETLRKVFYKNYNELAYPTLAELFDHCLPDVVVVACPTNLHFTVIDEIFRFYNPQAILCEKPLAYCNEDAEAINNLCRVNGVKLFVNYIRRADPGVLEVKNRLIARDICLPFKAVVWYSKGVLHNGSHFLDLMTFWFGPVQSIKLIDAGPHIGEEDAEPDFHVDFVHGSAIFCSASEENFSHYTLELVAKNGRLRYEKGGVINWQGIGKHETLIGRYQLESSVEAIDHDMNRYQYHVVEQLNQALIGKQSSLCVGADAVKTINWLQELLDQRKQLSGI